MENDNFISLDVDSLVKPTVNRQIAFDRFLTYRRRMGRLVAVQSIYLFDMNTRIDKSQKLIPFETNIDKENQEDGNQDENEYKLIDKNAIMLCQEVIYFYKHLFFGQQEYGWNRKNKKVDELFAYQITSAVIKNEEKINELISAKLNEKWTISKLDYVVRSILKCAIGEIFIESNYNKIEKAVLVSEYTNIASNFFYGKEIGFINSIIDKIAKEYLK